MKTETLSDTTRLNTFENYIHAFYFGDVNV